MGTGRRSGRGHPRGGVAQRSGDSHQRQLESDVLRESAHAPTPYSLPMSTTGAVGREVKCPMDMTVATAGDDSLPAPHGSTPLRCRTRHTHAHTRALPPPEALQRPPLRLNPLRPAKRMASRLLGNQRTKDAVLDVAKQWKFIEEQRIQVREEVVKQRAALEEEKAAWVRERALQLQAIERERQEMLKYKVRVAPLLRHLHCACCVGVAVATRRRRRRVRRVVLVRYVTSCRCCACREGGRAGAGGPACPRGSGEHRGTVQGVCAVPRRGAADAGSRTRRAAAPSVRAARRTARRRPLHPRAARRPLVWQAAAAAAPAAAGGCCAEQRGDSGTDSVVSHRDVQSLAAVGTQGLVQSRRSHC
jgi:hypothetical protein